MTRFVSDLASNARTPLEASTVAEAFQRVVASYPDKLALRSIDGALSLTWRQLNDEVRAVAAGLAGLGLRKGEPIALLLPNLPECHVVDYAAMHLGAVPFAIFNSSSAEQIAEQLRRSEARIVVTEARSLERVRSAARKSTAVTTVIVIDGSPEESGLVTLDAVKAAAPSDFDFDATWRSVSPDDLITIIFTSGTTGAPKAAQWSHACAMNAQRAMDAGIPVTRDGVVSFLPLAHAGGRLTVHYMALAYGATITACPNMAEAGLHIACARPDALLSVPRVFEKLQVAIEGLIAKLDDEDRATAERVVDIGLRLARSADGASDESLDDPTVRSLESEHRAGLPVIRAILERVGLDRLRSAIVGGAPASRELVYFFRAIGIPLMEAYGSSEAALPIFNRVDRYKTGTAGLPLPGVEVSLDTDGELLIRSAFNFVGYRGQPDETSKTVDDDGWLRTGDVAEIDGDGFVRIVDRKKELMISSAGKNMSPTNIELAIKGESSLIGQIMSVGDGRNYVTALITLDPEAVANFAAGRPLPVTGTWHDDPRILTEIDKAVARGNSRLSRPEQVKRFRVLPEPWLPDGDELTPTAKLKRRNISSKYAPEIEALYAP